MLPILNDINRLYTNSSNVASQVSDRTAIGPSQNIGGNSQSHSNGRSRTIGGSRSGLSNTASGPAVRVELSSGGRDIQNRIQKARRLRLEWEDTHSSLTNYAAGPASVDQSDDLQRGQLVQVLAPSVLAGQVMSVVQLYRSTPAGRDVAVCTDFDGTTMAFDSAELLPIGV